MSRIQMMGALALSLGWRLRESAEKGLPEYHKPFHLSRFRRVSWASESRPAKQ